MNTPTILSRNGSNFHVEGREQPEYLVTRDGARFYCECRNGRPGYLCRHVKAVIKFVSAERGWDRVGFWRTEAEAKRQHRRMVEFRTKDRRFWVTYDSSWAPKNRGARMVIKPPMPGSYYPDIWDVRFQKAGRVWRESVRR